eukprot:11100999-Alexandrium_andersonii.AAC.1
MTKLGLAGDSFGLELRRLFVREREAPERPLVQHGFSEALGAPQALPGRGGAPGQTHRAGGRSGG